MNLCVANKNYFAVGNHLSIGQTCAYKTGEFDFGTRLESAFVLILVQVLSCGFFLFD